jgi:dTDP-4-amino-4,6-dideoxygalactose transaminase
VVPVDYAGLPAPVAEIRAAVGPDVVLIEDAAHAHGARRADGPVGDCRHVDMTMFSFHPVKPVTTAEGGMLTMRDEGLRDTLREFRSHGMRRGERWWMEQHALGFNYRLSDLQSALGRSQLAKLDRFIAARNTIAARYRDELAGLPLTLPPAAPEGALHGYHLFAVHSDRRRDLYDGLRERGVLAQVHFIPVYWHPWYRETYGYARGLCPAAEEYYAGCLSLPCFPALSDADHSAVVAAVRELAA